MHVPLPENDNVLIVTVEAEAVYDFSQELSPAVAAAVPVALQQVLELINN
jgi:Ni,Fe-hydrogenase maturation factor